MIYASYPNADPDTEFVKGELRHLVVGNRGRLLDARRTPITIVAVAPETGAFELEVGAFEDAGARWELALEEVARLEFARGGGLAERAAVSELERAAARFDGELVVDCDPAVRTETLRRIASEQRAVREHLERGAVDRLDVVGVCRLTRGGRSADRAARGGDGRARRR